MSRGLCFEVVGLKKERLKQACLKEMPKQVRHDTFRAQYDKIGSLLLSKRSPQPLLLFDDSGFIFFCKPEA